MAEAFREKVASLSAALGTARRDTICGRSYSAS